LFFERPDVYDPKALKKVWKEKTPSLLQAVAKTLSRDGDTTQEKLRNMLNGVAEGAGLGLGALMGPLRVVIVGSLSGPDLFSLINTLGSDEVVSRIHSALKVIE